MADLETSRKSWAILVAPWLASVAVASMGAPARAEDAIIEEDDGENPGIEGVVFLSSGERLRGKVSVTDGNALRVFDLRSGRTHLVDLDGIEAIRTIVESETMVEAWAFEEEGSRKKIRLGWSYPLRSFRQEVQLSGGQVIEGHCNAAVVYVETGKETRKLVLPRQMKGKRDQTVADLVFPASIQLGPAASTTGPTPRPPAELATLRGRVSGLRAVALVDTKQGVGYAGSVGKDGAFEVTGMLPGEYTVFLRTEGGVTAGLGGAEVAEPDLAAIRVKVAALAEFFDERRILAAGGPAEAPWILVELDRKGETTLAEEKGRSFRVRRWEMWGMRKEAAAWKVGWRAFLDRVALPPGQLFPSSRYASERRCELVRLAAGENALP